MARSGINQPCPIGKVAAPGRHHFIEMRQVLGLHRQIRIQNHQNVARGRVESQADGVGFAASGLLEGFEGEVGVPLGDDLLDRGPGGVAGMAFDEDYFGVRTELGESIDRGLNIPGFIAGRDNHGAGGVGGDAPRLGSGHDVIGQAQMLQTGEVNEYSITEGR